MAFDVAVMTGTSDAHLVAYQGQRVHKAVLQPLVELTEAAAAAGFRLAIASGFRSFERQRCIWNEKARGQRPILSDEGEPLNFHALSAEQRLYGILRWSALPGASRHHWGSDFDLFDAGALAPGEKVQLTVAETLGDGPFAPLHSWLDHYLADSACDFFRPYVAPKGGVAPEPWHLSFAPVASAMQRQLGVDHLRQAVQRADIELKDLVLEQIEEIYQRFVWVPWDRYPPSYRSA